MSESITIVRQFRGVGIDAKLNGYDMETMQPVRRSVYHGRIVYIVNGKQIGLPSINKSTNRCKIIFEHLPPF